MLERELNRDDHQRSRRAAEALGRLGPQALPLLIEASRHRERGVRRRAAKALGQIDAPRASRALEPMLDDPDPNTRRAALRAILHLAQRPGSFGAARGLGRSVAAALAAGQPRPERELALRVAARIGWGYQGDRAKTQPEDTSPEALLELAGDDPTLRQAAFELLARGRDFETLTERVRCGSHAEARAAVHALVGAEAPPELFAELDAHPDAAVRLAALRGLAAWPDDLAAREKLRAALSDEDPAARWLADRGLAGALDRRRAAIHRGRLPAEGPSARWPFGLPPPEPGAPRRARLPLAVATTNLSYNLNLGVLIRSAEAAGAAEVLIAGRDYSHRVAAMGADRWVDLRFFDTMESLLDHARSRGYQIVAVQQSPGAERFDRADYPPRPCLLLGSEGPGLAPELCARSDLVVEIPQRGEIDSLNLGCAATLVLWACLIRRGWL